VLQVCGSPWTTPGRGSVSFNSLFDVHADIIKIDIDVTRGIESDPMKEAMAAA